MSSKKRDRIEAAYRKLPVNSHVDWMISVMAKQLEGLPAAAQIPPAFKVVGRSATKSELEDLASIALRLVKRIESLHEPAITALADAGLWDRSSVKRYAKTIADTARAADLSEVPEKQGGGRPSGMPLNITKILAGDYEVLTGAEPTRSDGRNSAFLDFVTEIFQILGVQASPEWMVRSALEFRRTVREQSITEETTEKNIQ